MDGEPQRHAARIEGPQPGLLDGIGEDGGGGHSTFHGRRGWRGSVRRRIRGRGSGPGGAPGSGSSRRARERERQRGRALRPRARDLGRILPELSFETSSEGRERETQRSVFERGCLDGDPHRPLIQTVERGLERPLRGPNEMEGEPQLRAPDLERPLPIAGDRGHGGRSRRRRGGGWGGSGRRGGREWGRPSGERQKLSETEQRNGGAQRDQPLATCLHGTSIQS